ncbi:putative secondary Na+/bile acid symporter, bile acid:Na+ symporter (BASS) family [Corynebacterium glutamicum MB001]|uniref:Predicted Na+-dependent transporter n=2 Tax=Corynebacterium TaxID=1716 RepID=Q8NN79_CORGL|nr:MULTISPECIES: bile acid:sodium symporter family protein [Corynebacterium]AGT06056.1 putative secondary Na+/bile acid symporter, bile acid:Na+ symporter (BASS) family [Corynebacterium glutamicum MB001]AIK85755.1 Na+-dependent transporter [Corynebacterium glutamicum]AIK88540.1 Na+-dependent transporter [Corynebacterium glutamicum]AKF28089.1 Na+-dependent transporter [[Brevibacterium] flavum]ALP50749.1 Na+-dependent transporter [Corynebacterium glutamicum]
MSKTEEGRSAAIIIYAFPTFILLGAIIAFIFPEPFIPLTNYINIFLTIIMFTMGLTLTVPDFQMVLKRPLPILIGVVAQFVIMPFLAIVVAKMFNLNPALAVGLLMLGSVPGGTSSNVIAFLARGDVALSVTMTSVSTIVSPIMTPFLMLMLAGTETAVDGGGMAWTLVQTVLLPVIIGLVLRVFLNKWIDKILPILPYLSILGIGGVVFGAVAANAERLVSVGLIVFVAVIVHNVLGYVVGYLTGRVFKFPEAANRTMAIEIGTQSAGLASGMAGRFFTPEAALPGAVAALVHNITGAVYVGLVRNRPLTKASRKKESVAVSS